MRRRAAILATLFNVIVCSLLITACSVTAANLQNDIIREEMRVTCRLSAEIMESEAFRGSPETYLRDIAEDGNVYFAFFKDDNVAYSNFGYIPEKPDENELSVDLRAPETFIRRMQDGTKIICVSAQLNDGSVLLYAKESLVPAELLGSYAWVAALVVFAALVMQYIIIYRCVELSDRMVESTMEVLEEISDGRFDTTINSSSVAANKVTAKYNATLARVRDRVFRQQRRNVIIGQVLNQMMYGIITVDRELVIGFVTNLVGTLLGVDITDAENKNLMEVFHREDLVKAVMNALNDNNGNMSISEIEGKQANGSARPLRVITSPFFREGKPAGALCVIEDYTEIKKLEQIRTDFAANVSHEMKTPLTSIKGFVETLQAGAIDNPAMAKKFLNIIMLEADRLTRLINDILSITKMESGKENVEIKRIPLDLAVMEVCELLKINAADKQVTIYARPNSAHSYVMGNPDRVKQLLINLIENGIKYNKVGGSVTVRVYEDKEHVNLSVADTGIGIKEEHLGRLFERFYRVDKGRSREMGGTGLGLAIVKHIVNSMNGYFEVNSKYGEGTEFLITLPKAAEEYDPTGEDDDTEDYTEE